MWWSTLLIGLGVIVGGVVLVNLIGLFLPKSHTASRRVEYQQPASVIWETISDFGKHATWRDDVRQMKQLDDRACPEGTGELHRPHHIDLKSGMYRGRQVLEPKDDI